MLSDIAADILHFLSRRDLDKACGVNKWFDSMIAQYCDIYPLRPVRAVSLYLNDSRLNVWVEHSEVRPPGHSFTTLDDAVNFAGVILQYSYTESLQLGIRNTHNIRMKLFADHWATLMDAIPRCGVRHLQFSCVDISALDDDAFRVALECRGVQSFEVHRSVFPSGFIANDLVRASVGKSLLRLEMSGNQHDTRQRLSDDAVLDFFFRADAPAGGQSLSLRLAGTGLTDMFLRKFIERLQSSSARRPSGILTVNGGGATLRGLSAYAHYLTPSGIHGRNATYRFPPADNTNKSFEVAISGSSNSFRIKFHASE